MLALATNLPEIAIVAAAGGIWLAGVQLVTTSSASPPLYPDP